MFEQVFLVLVAALGFGLLVFVHELGHFLAAKLLRIRVEAFSLGFGPHLHRRWGGTDYRLSLVPLGGYVRLAGEAREEGRRPAPDEFFGRPVWQRCTVLLAGVFMNGVLAVAAFTVAFAVGVPKPPPVLGYVRPGGPAWKAGLRAGDRVVEVNGERRRLDFTSVSEAALFADRDEPIRLVVERGGRELEFSVLPEYDEKAGFRRIQVESPNTLEIAALYWVRPDGKTSLVDDPEHAGEEARAACPALAAGLRPGDVLLEAAGVRLDDASTFSDEIVHDSGGEPIALTYRRGGEIRRTEVVPLSLGAWRLGVVCRTTVVDALRRGSWAERAGLCEGDEIVAVAGRPVRARSQILAAAGAVGEAPEAAVEVRVRGGGEERSLLVARADLASLDDAVHFRQGNIVDRLTPGFPAATEAGLQPGDELVEIALADEEAVGGWRVAPVREQSDLSETVSRSEGRPVRLTWRRDGETLVALVRPKRAYLVGVMFKALEEPVRLGLADAAVYGTRNALQWLPKFVLTIRGFFTGGFSPRHLGGPVNIAVYTYRAAGGGPGLFAYFLGFISINLALFNVLPIPVLDGGHILFALIEKLKGSPVSSRVQTAASYVGLALLVTLLLFATFNDLFRRFEL